MVNFPVIQLETLVIFHGVLYFWALLSAYLGASYAYVRYEYDYLLAYRHTICLDTVDRYVSPVCIKIIQNCISVFLKWFFIVWNKHVYDILIKYIESSI